LRRIDLPARLLEPEPRRAVDLGKLAAPSRLRRPLQLDRVPAQRCGIGAPAHGPGVHDLPAALLHLAERQLRPLGCEAGLLRELAVGDREQLLALLDLALRDRPGAQILAREQRSAGM